MSVKLLTEHYLEFLSLKGGCTGSSESTLVKMPHCWKSHAAAHIMNQVIAVLAQLLNPLIYKGLKNDLMGRITLSGCARNGRIILNIVC